MKISSTLAALLGANVSNNVNRRNTQLDRSVVRDFEIEDFAGVWYEIARIENEGERGLSHVTATFMVDGDGMTTLRTEGFDSTRGVFEITRSRISTPDSERQAAMRTSGMPWTDRDINVLEVDADYNFALVGGRSANRLWILSRAPFIPEDDLRYLIARALERGYDISQLAFPDQCTVLSQDEALALAV